MAIVTARWTARDHAGDGYTVRRMAFPSQQAQIAFLRRMVNVYRMSETIARQAREIIFDLYHLPPRARAQHALALGRWVQTEIRYINEGVEKFQTPIRTLENGAGDCDDCSSLIATLCESVGIPCQLVGIAWQPPGEAFGFRHIIPRAVVPGPNGPRLIPLDATLPDDLVGTVDPVARARARHGKIALCIG